jgi:hypothetical protein
LWCSFSFMEFLNHVSGPGLAPVRTRPLANRASTLDAVSFRICPVTVT